ncbi:MAG: S-methyl-5'-thioadenosine phosphorylase [Amylibacter sp.]|jgi:5'-methylthioadenosine phosphorylase|nr:S-methyl-5'-thioadenosine phosphorylase [Amylibacter sp.]
MILGIIGGSGIYEIDDLEDPQWISVNSSFGSPSDDVLVGHIKGIKMVFLPRHGRGHIQSPSSINYRANIDVMKRCGVTDIISISACGSFREDLRPGDFVIVDQFIDRTFSRDKTFFGPGCVAHVSLAKPTCSRLSEICQKAASVENIKVHMGGCYLAMEGPQFSTLAESKLYREIWGCDVIGMTNMPEAKLAREAEICYTSVAMITDYDSWHPDHGEVDITNIIKTLRTNAENAKKLVAYLPKLLTSERSMCTEGCDKALEFAILTQPNSRDPKMVKKLDAVAGRVLK